MPQNRTAGGRAIPRVSAGQAYLGLGQRANKRMPPDYAKDLAYLMQVDPRDKAEMDKARRALEKAMRNIVSAGADYEAVLAELSKVQKANTGKDGKPKDLKELKEMRQELKEVLTVINKLSKRQAVSDESLATLSPLMKKLAESISAIKMGQLGTADLHAAMMASGAGKKTDVEGLAKIYKKNTELARKDWHTFMSQALKLQQSVGSRRDALSKELLTPFLGNTSPTVHTLKEMLGEDKSFYNAVKEYWSNSLKESEAVRRERETQSARFENQGEAKENSERMFQEETLEHDKVLLKTTKEIKSLLEDLNATATSSMILEATQVVESALNVGSGGAGGAEVIPTGKALGALAALAARVTAALVVSDTTAKIIQDGLAGKKTHNASDINVLNTSIMDLFGIGQTAANATNYVLSTGPQDAFNSYAPDGLKKFDKETLTPAMYTGFDFLRGEGKFSGGDIAKDYTAGKASVGDLIRDTSEKDYGRGVNPGLLAAVLSQESSLGKDKKAQKLRVNDKGEAAGAQGIGQLSPDALADIYSTYGVSIDPMDPKDGVRGANLYLRLTQERLSKKGIVPTDENTYLAYVLGVGGAASFLRDFKNNPDAPNKVTNNPEIFAPNGVHISNREALSTVYGLLQKRMPEALNEAENVIISGAYSRRPNQPGGPTFSTTVVPNAGRSVNRAAPISPAPAPVQQAPASPPAGPVGQNAENPVSIDSIPMFVDDTGLMLISIGGLV